MLKGVFSQSIIARAVGKKLIEIDLVNLRDFARDKHQTVDDKPYGGGKGMVARVDIVVNATESLKPKPYHILLSASGAKYNQRKAQTLAKKKAVSLICGHYEGIDARVEEFVDEVLSIGDFVLTGGEIAAMAIVDSVTRLIPGVIRAESLKSESFSQDSSLITNHSSLLIVAIEQSTKSVPYDQFNYTLPICLIVGNETKGISKEVLKMADAVVELPMFGVNKSLNVMVSLGIVLYKVVEL